MNAGTRVHYSSFIPEIMREKIKVFNGLSDILARCESSLNLTMIFGTNVTNLMLEICIAS